MIRSCLKQRAARIQKAIGEARRRRAERETKRTWRIFFGNLIQNKRTSHTRNLCCLKTYSCFGNGCFFASVAGAVGKKRRFFARPPALPVDVGAVVTLK